MHEQDLKNNVYNINNMKCINYVTYTYNNWFSVFWDLSIILVLVLYISSSHLTSGIVKFLEL